MATSIKRAMALGDSLHAFHELVDLIPDGGDDTGLKYLLSMLDEKLQEQFSDVFETVCVLSKQEELIIPNSSTHLVTAVHQ